MREAAGRAHALYIVGEERDTAIGTTGRWASLVWMATDTPPISVRKTVMVDANRTEGSLVAINGDGVRPATPAEAILARRAAP